MTDPLESTTQNSPGATRRQSCDRCHGQKLRCTRSGNRNTGACNRCLRQGAPCIYSFSLPKGRPSMYRAVRGPREEQQPAVAAKEPPSMALDPVPCASPQSISHTLPAAASSQSNPKEAPISDAWKGSSQTDPICDQDNPTLTTVDDSPAGLWAEIDTFSWGDMGMELGGGQGRSIYSSNIHAQPSMNHLFDEPYPAEFTFDGEAINESVVFSSNSSIIGLPPAKQILGSEASIAQLSTFITRLYPLQKSSNEVIAAQQSSGQTESTDATQTVTLIDDAAFQLLASWLVRVSSSMDLENAGDCSMKGTAPSGSILPDIFCSSMQLMGILRSLQGHTAYPSDRTPSSSSRSPDSIIETNMSRASNQVRTSTQGSDTVVRHLIIACHTLLLSIYVAVLTALKNDIHLTGPSHSGFDHLIIGIGRDGGLKDMRWIVVIQVCSYLIERQCSMVNAHMNTRSYTVASESSSEGSCFSPSTPVGREEMNDLEMEVKQRIVQFRQFLRM